MLIVHCVLLVHLLDSLGIVGALFGEINIVDDPLELLAPATGLAVLSKVLSGVSAISRRLARLRLLLLMPSIGSMLALAVSFLL